MISTRRGTAFESPYVICELQLLHSERYRPSGMLIFRKNSYAPLGKRFPGRREAQSCGTSQQSKNPPCIILGLNTFDLF
jgi:hypothetical protein